MRRPTPAAADPGRGDLVRRPSPVTAGPSCNTRATTRNPVDAGLDGNDRATRRNPVDGCRSDGAQAAGSSPRSAPACFPEPGTHTRVEHGWVDAEDMQSASDIPRLRSRSVMLAPGGG